MSATLRLRRRYRRTVGWRPRGTGARTMDETREGSGKPLFEEITNTQEQLPGARELGPGFEAGAVVASAEAAAEDDLPLAYEPKPIPPWKTLTYSSGNFGSGIFYAFNNYLQVFFLTPLGA